MRLLFAFILSGCPSWVKLRTTTTGQWSLSCCLQQKKELQAAERQARGWPLLSKQSEDFGATSSGMGRPFNKRLIFGDAHSSRKLALTAAGASG